MARGFVDLGYTKRSLIEWCAENAKLPARDYWDDQWSQDARSSARASPASSPMRAGSRPAPDELVQSFTPDDIKIVVTGGETQGAFKMFGGRYAGRGPGTFNKENPTVVIDAWR